jgi:reverse gyrase
LEDLLADAKRQQRVGNQQALGLIQEDCFITYHREIKRRLDAAGMNVDQQIVLATLFRNLGTISSSSRFLPLFADSGVGVG